MSHNPRQRRPARLGAARHVFVHLYDVPTLLGGKSLEVRLLQLAFLVDGADPGVQSDLDQRRGGRISFVHTEVGPHRDNHSCATRQQRVFYLPDKGEICRLREFVSDLYPKYAELDDLGR